MAASKVSGFGSASRTTILLLTLIGFFFLKFQNMLFYSESPPQGSSEDGSLVTPA